jgi:peroxiredoxin
MKFVHLIALIVLSVGLFNCQSGGVSEGTLIRGELANAANLSIYLDKISINTPNEVLANAPIDGSGNFALGFVNGLEPGIYQLRVGAQKAVIALGEGDNLVDIKGNISDFGLYKFDVTGSDAAREMVSTMRELRAGSVTLEQVKEIVEGVKNPETGAFIAFNALARSGPDGLPVQKVALERLPNSSTMKATYATFIQSLEGQYAQQQASERIQVGQPAPDIRLPNPDGKEYALSDLKGKVVLLDFWASWCGPCRRENPNVVKVYDKYKADGFTIFSVSLDGLDPRRAGGLTGEALAQANEPYKERWVNAIEKDQLSWPYHVSELKKWSSQAGQSYGITSIPKTFLIDRDGKIAAVGLRGAVSIEQALKEVI